jgi:hypothetical protein
LICGSADFISDRETTAKVRCATIDGRIEIYLIVTVLSRIFDPSVAVEIPPAAAAAPPAAAAPVAAFAPVALFAVEAVLAFVFFGRASAGIAKSKNTMNDTTPTQDCGIIAMMKINVQRQGKSVKIRTELNENRKTISTRCNTTPDKNESMGRSMVLFDSEVNYPTVGASEPQTAKSVSPRRDLGAVARFDSNQEPRFDLASWDKPLLAVKDSGLKEQVHLTPTFLKSDVKCLMRGINFLS